MIITLFVNIILVFINAVFYVVSCVIELGASCGTPVETIPLFDSALLSGFGYWNAFLVEFPMLQVVWQCAVWYFGFKIMLLLIKFFFGHRVNI